MRLVAVLGRPQGTGPNSVPPWIYQHGNFAELQLRTLYELGVVAHPAGIRTYGHQIGAVTM